MMKQFLAKYLFLSYHTRILDRDFSFVRAATVIVPVFCIAVLLTLLADLGFIFWGIFSLLILLTFPIVKSRLINWVSFIFTSLLIILSFESNYSWWEPIPLYYFSLGFFVDRTRFLFFSVKFKDLEDWEQMLQYLQIPDGKKSYDETEPAFEEQKKIIQKLRELKEAKFGYKSNVNVIPFMIPIVSIILLIVVLIIFREHIESFPDIRGF